MSTVLDFNRANFSDQSLNTLINELIERAEPPHENRRQYLGASAIGSECLRKVQYNWMCDPQYPARTQDIFDRGHFFEEVTRQHLRAAGSSSHHPSSWNFRLLADCSGVTLMEYWSMVRKSRR